MMEPLQLYSICLNITSLCNLACYECCVNAGKITSPGDLTLPEIRKVIQQARRIGARRIYLSGGEPLLRNDIAEIVAYVSDSGIEPRIITNATVVTKEFANHLNSSGVRAVNVGFSGITQKTFEHNRGAGTFKKARAGIVHCIGSGIEVAIDFVLTARNIHELPSIHDFAIALGCQRVNLRRFVPIGRGKRCKELTLTPIQMREALAIWCESAAKYSPVIRSTIHEPLFLVYLGQLGQLENVDPLGIDCNADASERGWIGIAADGTIYPCPMLSGVTLGNVKESSLRDALASTAYAFFKNQLRHLSGPCQDCQWLAVCRGGCKATTYSLCGTYLSPDPCCWAKEMIPSNRTR